MKTIKLNEKFTIHDSEVENSIDLKNITIQKAKELIHWNTDEKHLYNNAKIKLYSHITGLGVSLFNCPNPYSEVVTRTFFKTPYLTIND